MKTNFREDLVSVTKGLSKNTRALSSVKNGMWTLARSLRVFKNSKILASTRREYV